MKVAICPKCGAKFVKTWDDEPLDNYNGVWFGQHSCAAYRAQKCRPIQAIDPVLFQPYRLPTTGPRLAPVEKSLVTTFDLEQAAKKEEQAVSQTLSAPAGAGPKSVSALAYGRMLSNGIWCEPMGAAHGGCYRRSFDAIEYRTVNETWGTSKHPELADAALTAAGWPPDLEIESIGGRYVPTPLEGRWTRLYWRTVETAALWCRRTKWLFTGQSGAVQHRALAGR